MPPHRDWSRRPLSLFLALLVAMSAGLAAGGLFDPVEDALTARRAELLTASRRARRPSSRSTPESLAELRSWPWPRSYHAQVVRSSISPALRSSPSTSTSAPVPSAATRSWLRQYAKPAMSCFRSSQQTRQAAWRCAGARQPAGRYFQRRLGRRSEHLSRQRRRRSRISGGHPHRGRHSAVDRDACRGERTGWAIAASSPTGRSMQAQFRDFSFVDVMKGRVPPADVKGKRVLIGATAIELGDRYAVPRYGVVPGVVVQALAAESLLQDRAVQRTGISVTLLGILADRSAACAAPVRSPAALCGICAAAFFVGNSRRPGSRPADRGQCRSILRRGFSR